MQKFITRGYSNVSGTRIPVLVDRIEYWGYDENAFMVHEICKQAWSYIWVVTYVSRMEKCKDGVVRPRITKVIEG